MLTQSRKFRVPREATESHGKPVILSLRVNFSMLLLKNVNPKPGHELSYNSLHWKLRTQESFAVSYFHAG